MHKEIPQQERIKPVTVKLVLVGEKMVGKTSLINRYFENQFWLEHKENLWMHITNKILNIPITKKRTIPVNFFVYDFGHEETFEEYFKPFSKEADGVLFIFDLSRRNTFQSIDDWVRNMKAICDPNVLKNAFLLGNKVDLKELRETTTEEGTLMAKKFNFIRYIETSAKDDIGVRESFEALTAEIILQATLNNYIN